MPLKCEYCNRKPLCKSQGNYDIVVGRGENIWLYALDGFLYTAETKKQRKSGKTYYYCQDVKTGLKCRAKAILNKKLDKMELAVKHGPHNHPQRFEKIQLNMIKQVFLNAAEIDRDKTLHQIYKDVCYKHEKVAHLVPSYKAINPGKESQKKR